MLQLITTLIFPQIIGSLDYITLYVYIIFISRNYSLSLYSISLFLIFFFTTPKAPNAFSFFHYDIGDWCYLAIYDKLDYSVESEKLNFKILKLTNSDDPTSFCWNFSSLNQLFVILMPFLSQTNNFSNSVES